MLFTTESANVFGRCHQAANPSAVPQQKRKSALRSQQQYLQARFAVPTGLHLNEIKLIRSAHLNVKLRLLLEPGRFREERAIPVHLEERQETLTICKMMNM